MAVYTLPELPYDYAALEPHISGKDHGAPPRQAPRRLRRRRQRRPGGSSTAAREAGDLRQRLQPVGEEPRLQPGRPHQPLHLLEEPVPQWRRPARRASWPQAIKDSFGSFEKFQRALHRHRHWASRARAGQCSPTTPSPASSSSSSSSSTSRATCSVGTDPAVHAAGHVGARLLPGLPQRQGRLRQGHSGTSSTGRTSRSAWQAAVAQRRGTSSCR